MKANALVACLALAASHVNAATLRERFEYDLTGDKFSAQELRLDLFATWRVPDEFNVGDGRLGSGVGMTYFFHMNWGVSVDTHLERLDVPENVNGSLIGRYPVPSTSVAPYLFAGGGRKFREGTDWTAHIGGGLDYRINKLTGIFIDVRRTFANEGIDFLLFRGGMNFGF